MTCPLDGDLSGRWCYPLFEQLGPGGQSACIFFPCLSQVKSAVVEYIPHR